MNSLEIRNWTSEYFIQNEISCKLILDSLDALENIPSINNAPSHNFRDGQLVKFRGMIQDMYNPEYYFQQYEVKNIQTGTCDIRCGMFTDCAHCLPHEEILFDSSKSKTSERQTCVVISIPGLNNWAKEKNENAGSHQINLTSNCNYKRSLDEDGCEEMDCSEPVQKKEKGLNQGVEINITKEPETKRGSVLSKEHMLNFPIPNNDGKACIVKIYNDEPLKLNQIVEIVGFISLNPILSSIHDSEETMDDIELNTHNPPASLISRLHAIKMTVIKNHEVQNTPEIMSKAQSIRTDLHIMLSQLLFGDHVAADYLICHLISSIYMRKDHLCLGSFPLNITNFPFTKYKTFPRDLYNFLTLLVKKSHYLEITLENLNDLALLPKKDYECNRLTSGILQLSNNTHLILDETGLASGQLSTTGRQNYNAISDLIKFQKVAYDFKYYTVEYEAEIPILILSEVKSFIPCPTQMALKTDPESAELYPQVVEAAVQYLKDESRVANIRKYLEVMRHAEFEFKDDITKVIQEDFIQMRQANKNITAENLHSLMVLARLMCLSNGINSLDTDYWKKVVQMEMERMNRLSHIKETQN